MIADFSSGFNQDNSGTSANLNGVWYGVGSSGNPTLNVLTTGGCNGSANYADITGTSGTTPPVYSTLQGDFIDGGSPSGPLTYNISTGAPAGTNAFVFCIKGSSSTGTVWFSCSDANTNGGDTAGVYIPITASWVPQTVCFNHMQSQGWGCLGCMFDPTQAISFSWKVTASGQPFDISISNFQFAQVAPASCPAFTATPTPNPLLIDNFEDGDNQVSVVAGRNGYWATYVDAYGSSVVPSAAGTFAPDTSPGDGSTYAAHISGTMAPPSNSYASVYAGLSGNFVNPQGPYNITTNVPGATGIAFKIKATYTNTCANEMPAVRFSVADNTTSSSSDTNGVAVTVPTMGTWTPVTVFFNQMMTTGSNVPQTHQLDLTTAIAMKWQFQGEGLGYDIWVDDIQFVTTAPPTATVPPTWSANAIDNMEDGDNQLLLNGPRNGYWYTVIDTAGGTICPPAAATGLPGAPFIMQPGGNAGSNYCARISGTTGAACGPPSYSNCPYAELGFNFLNSGGTAVVINSATVYEYDISALGLTGVQFYAKAATAGLGVGFGISDNTTDPSSDVNSYGDTYTASWALYQEPFAISHLVTAGWGVPQTHALDLTTIIAATWKIGTGTTPYDFSVDDVSFY